MTTANSTSNQVNETQTPNKKEAIVCVCCLTFFPVVYLIGSTLMNFLG